MRRFLLHQYKSNGLNIVLDVNSGAVHLVDDVTYDLLPLYETTVLGERSEKTKEELSEKLREENTAETKEAIIEQLSRTYPKADIEEALEEVKQLEQAGVLFTRDEYEDLHIAHTEPVVKALCLHIAHDCNLACRYCFAEEGEYHGRRALMSLETGKAALDFLIANSGNRRNLEVDFFGGEPLMNWFVVKEIVAYGRALEAGHDKHFRFTLTTNGVLLDEEMIAFANQLLPSGEPQIANVVLSLDGREEVHDRMRPFRGGQGSYELVAPKLLRFAKERGQKNYYVRGTFTRHNLDFAEDVLHLADLGFTQISVEPVVADTNEDYAIQTEDLPRAFAEYDALAAEMIRRRKEGKGFCFFHFMIDLEGGPCVAKRLRGCGAGTEYLAVTPWGDLYPCHQFAGEDGLKIGTVTEGITNTKLREIFSKVNVYSKPACKNCFAKFYCSGGCGANSYHFSETAGDTLAHKLNQPYEIGCELQRKRVECAIMIKAMESSEL
ncbi:thioether cross-link-forming SCIFF peptide maturase [Clostridia bacterium]|nr:thioether cross-link-forming SCIFF peptide maturase [Clostridia bacterium]